VKRLVGWTLERTDRSVFRTRLSGRDPQESNGHSQSEKWSQHYSRSFGVRSVRSPNDARTTTFEMILVDLGGQALHSSRYHLLPCDLRNPPADIFPGLFKDYLSPTLPTLLLFECVLVYMSPEASSILIQWFVDFFSPSTRTPLPGTLGCTVYEMFGLEDAFGQVMMNNLRVSHPLWRWLSDLNAMYHKGEKCFSSWGETISFIRISPHPFLKARVHFCEGADPS
jgi:hypothetical protein